MKNTLRLAAVLAILLCVCTCASVAAAESVHRYGLIEHRDVPGMYHCVCLDCSEELLIAYSADFAEAPALKTDGENCGHLFRVGEQIKRQSVESIGDMYHAPASWYDCTCEGCGMSVEAVILNTEMEQHTYTDWAGCHVNGANEHVYVSHCDVCAAMHVTVIRCTVWKDGSCQDPHHLLLRQGS